MKPCDLSISWLIYRLTSARQKRGKFWREARCRSGYCCRFHAVLRMKIILNHLSLLRFLRSASAMLHTSHQNKGYQLYLKVWFYLWMPSLMRRLSSVCWEYRMYTPVAQPVECPLLTDWRHVVLTTILAHFDATTQNVYFIGLHKCFAWIQKGGFHVKPKSVSFIVKEQ